MKNVFSLLLFPFLLLSCVEEGKTEVKEAPKQEVTEQKTARDLKETDKQNTPTANPEQSSSEDAFSSILDGNLLTLQSDKLVSLTGFKKPAKYYLFYKTASWCPPCQRFTPGLVNFYLDHKTMYGDDFEIILITSDRSLKDMEKYATKRKMGWPHLVPEQVKLFSSTFKFPGSGIPNTILTDTAGNIIETSYSSSGKYKGPHVPVQKLQSLLAAK